MTVCHREFVNDRVPQGICKWPCATENLRWPCATENLRWPCATESLIWQSATFIFHQFLVTWANEFSKKSQTSFLANFRRPGHMKFQNNIKLHFSGISIAAYMNTQKKNSNLFSFWNDRVPQGIWNDRVPRRIWDDHVPPNLLTKFHLSSLKSKNVGKKHALCAPCAPTVRPLCTPCATLVQFPKKSTVWPLRNLGPFEIDLGYCSTRSKDTAPQNQKILLHTQRKSW